MVRHVKVEYKKAEASWREDKWLVVYPSGVASGFEKKSQAVMEGKRYAKDNSPMELIIEKMNGDVSKIHNYGFR